MRKLVLVSQDHMTIMVSFKMNGSDLFSLLIIAAMTAGRTAGSP